MDKMFTGSKKIRQLGGLVNLVICQKSKVDDWIDHFMYNYYSSGADEYIILPCDLADLDDTDIFFMNIFISGGIQLVGVIDYVLILTRPELLEIKYTMVLFDEASTAQNSTALIKMLKATRKEVI